MLSSVDLIDLVVILEFKYTDQDPNVKESCWISQYKGVWACKNMIGIFRQKKRKKRKKTCAIYKALKVKMQNATYLGFVLNFLNSFLVKRSIVNGKSLKMSNFSVHNERIS